MFMSHVRTWKYLNIIPNADVKFEKLGHKKENFPIESNARNYSNDKTAPNCCNSANEKNKNKQVFHQIDRS